MKTSSIDYKRLERASTILELKATSEGVWLDLLQTLDRRNWKCSTGKSNQERIDYHLFSEFGKRASVVSVGMSCRFSWTSRPETDCRTPCRSPRWDLKQILELAWAEGYISRNPASLLFVPKEAKNPLRLAMNLAAVNKLFILLEHFKASNYGVYRGTNIVPTIADPGYESVNVTKRLPAKEFDDFMTQMKSAVQKAGSAFNSTDKAASRKLWRQLFGSQFGQ